MKRYEERGKGVKESERFLTGPERLNRASARRSTMSSYQRIWEVIRRIPRGRVATYGQVAALAGMDGAARLVGYALHAAHDHALPWHRVVNARGRLSLARKDPASATTQHLRLEHEGVTFVRGAVKLELHRWKPRKLR
jgi:methylated-DNA-protein-cysteine methyltransferase-like protein